MAHSGRPSTQRNHFVEEYIAGCLAGSANIFSGYSFDTVKVRLRAYFPSIIFLLSIRSKLKAVSEICLCTSRLQASPPGAYRSAWQCFRAILHYEGVCTLDLNVDDLWMADWWTPLLGILAQPPAKTGNLVQVRGLYRGVTAPVIGGALETGMRLLVVLPYPFITQGSLVDRMAFARAKRDAAEDDRQ
jgi:hypothetical protein